MPRSKKGQVGPAENEQLSNGANSSLEVRLKKLEEEISELKQRIEVLVPEEIVVLRSVSREQAKDEIKELFKRKEVLYYSDIARRLKLDLPLVVELCQELMEEGEIYVNTKAKSRA
jgi:hypothetical protein